MSSILLLTPIPYQTDIMAKFDGGFSAHASKTEHPCSHSISTAAKELTIFFYIMCGVRYVSFGKNDMHFAFVCIHSIGNKIWQRENNRRGADKYRRRQR